MTTISSYTKAEDDYRIAMEYSDTHYHLNNDELDELIRLMKIANERNLECNNLDKSLFCSLKLFLLYSLNKKENTNAINYLNISFDIFKITKSIESIKIMKEDLNIYIEKFNDYGKLETSVIFDIIIDNFKSFKEYINRNRKNELNMKKIYFLTNFMSQNTHIFYYKAKSEDRYCIQSELINEYRYYSKLINKIK